MSAQPDDDEFDTPGHVSPEPSETTLRDRVMWDLGRGAREAAQRHAAHLAAEEASEEARLSGADPDEVEAAATRAALAIMSTYDQDEAPVWTDEGSSVWSSDPEAPADPEVEELVARRRKALQAKADKIMQAEVEKLREGVRDQLKLEAAVVDAVFRRTATAEAEVRLRAANAAPAPEPVSLQSFLLMEDGEEEWWVEGLLPQDGITLLSAPQKSGKTTLIGNLVRTLVDGDKFLNAFTVKRAQRVVLIDTESGDRRLRRWLGDQRIVNAEAVMVVSLRGQETSLDVQEDASREHWRQVFEGADVVILDVVGPVIASLGLNESDNADVGGWFAAWRSLLVSAGVSSGLVVHHTGHNEGRAIGASSWLRYPDVIWGITRETEDPTSPRYLSAYGRDVEVPAAELTFDPATRALTYTGQRKTEAMASRHVELLRAWLEQEGRKTTNACTKYLTDDHGVPQKTARSVPRQGMNENVLRVSPRQPGDGSRAVYYEVVTDLDDIFGEDE